jgi:CheY-like chemotaxis protein
VCYHEGEPSNNLYKYLFSVGANLTGSERTVPTILIIDDEPSIAEVVAEVLLDEGYDPQTAASGREALALLAERRPDLILLDLFMPEMNGLDLLAHLQGDPALALIPVVLMTAGALCELDLHHSGVAQVISKPFNLNELIATVQTLVEPALPYALAKE